jgi:hypothetical protein
MCHSLQASHTIHHSNTLIHPSRCSVNIHLSFFWCSIQSFFLVARLYHLRLFCPFILLGLEYFNTKTSISFLYFKNTKPKNQLERRNES